MIETWVQKMINEQEDFRLRQRLVAAMKADFAEALSRFQDAIAEKE